jgi:hypothetical protein
MTERFKAMWQTTSASVIAQALGVSDAGRRARQGQASRADFSAGEAHQQQSQPHLQAARATASIWMSLIGSGLASEPRN